MLFLILYASRSARSRLSRVAMFTFPRGGGGVDVLLYYYYIRRGRVSGAHTKKQTHSDEAAAAASAAADTRRVMTRRPVDPKESGSGVRTVGRTRVFVSMRSLARDRKPPGHIKFCYYHLSIIISLLFL